ncbi:MAG: DUF4340 domain-containing protein [Planctomycetota bacterium]|nr:DUF4340 domain-containing protein [Planctomycetota bacterium]
MKQVKTTAILAAFAAVSFILAFTVYLSTQPEQDDQHELIGEVFYPDFNDVLQASSMELIVWDPEKKETRQFEVAKVDNIWTIPDHDNYPVESPQRLRDSAGSVMNIKRLHLAGKTPEDHERLGVVDPKDENAKLKEAHQIGDRIRLLDDSGNVVCDFIIGKAVEVDAGEENSDERELVKGERYYVREPDKNETYTAVLDLQISTDFSDWIDSDLMQVGDASIQKIQLKNYEVAIKPLKEFGGQPVPIRDKYEEILAQQKDFNWTLEGLNEETEELDSAPLSDLANQLKSLKILDVQPKPSYEDGETRVLNGDLTVNLPQGVDRQDARFIQEQAVQVLGQEGYILGFEDEKNLKQPTLLSRNGELNFATDDGLVYHLVFGNDVKVKGNEFEFAKPESANPSGKDEKNEAGKSDDSTAGGDQPGEAPDSEEGTQSGKIMSVHVTFDPTLIEKPTPPVKPVEPVRPSKPDEKGAGAKAEDAAAPKPAAPKSPAPKAPAPKAAEDLKKEAPAKADPAESGKKAGLPKTQTPQDSEAKKDASGCGEFPFDQEGEQEKKGAEQKPAAEKKEPAAPTGEKQEKAKSDGATGPQSKSAATPGQKDQEKQKTDPPALSEAPGSEPPSVPKNPAEPGNQEPKEEKPKTPEEIYQEKLNAYNQAFLEYQSALAQYEEDVATFEKELKDYEKKVEEMRQKTDDLNLRFADWFYIVDAENLDKVKINRGELVKPKEKKEEEGQSGGLNLPNANQLPPNLNLPNLPKNPLDDLPGTKQPGTKQPSTKEKEQPKKEAPKKETTDPAKAEKKPTPPSAAPAPAKEKPKADPPKSVPEKEAAGGN